MIRYVHILRVDDQPHLSIVGDHPIPPAKTSHPIRLLHQGRPPVYTACLTLKTNLHGHARSGNRPSEDPTGMEEGPSVPFEQPRDSGGEEEISEVETNIISQAESLAVESETRPSTRTRTRVFRNRRHLGSPSRTLTMLECLTGVQVCLASMPERQTRPRHSHARASRTCEG